MSIGAKIKQLRQENKVTQDQLAKHLNISFQAVSKWENEETQPDIGLLIPIARFFRVSVDQLLEESAEKSGYRSRRDELLTLYECSKDEADFKKATKAYEDVILHGVPTANDYWSYAYLYDVRAKWDTQVAFEYYLKAINCQDGAQEEISSAYGELIRFMMRNARQEEALELLLSWHKGNTENIYPYIQLANYYNATQNYKKALEYAEQVEKIEPEHPEVLLITGDVNYHMKNYEKALEYWKRSFEMDDSLGNAIYSQADLYEQIGELDQAIETWEEIISWHKRRGYDLGPEMNYPKRKLEDLRNHVTR
jgi:transcriptional regulator with XRE-family HTH domain